MVKLVVDDLYQTTTLEWMLVVNHIDHALCLRGEHPNGLKPPYLVVDGVPLDFDRSIKYIKEQCEHE